MEYLNSQTSDHGKQFLSASSCAQEPDTTIQSPSSAKSKKRKRGEGKAPIVRALFSKAQVSQLEKRFREQSFLSKEERQELAEEVGITERQVMIWFQNRRGRLKKRGPLDGAYNPAKLQEINVRRPYPFLCGVITNQHQYRQSESGNQQFSVYPKEVQSHIDSVVGQMPTSGRMQLKEITGEFQPNKRAKVDPDMHSPPPNVTVFDMNNSGTVSHNTANCNHAPKYVSSPDFGNRSDVCGKDMNQNKDVPKCPVENQGMPGSFMHDLMSPPNLHPYFPHSQALYVNTEQSYYPGYSWPQYQQSSILTTVPQTQYGYSQSHLNQGLISPWCSQVPHITNQTNNAVSRDYSRLANYRDSYNQGFYRHNFNSTGFEQQHLAQVEQLHP